MLRPPSDPLTNRTLHNANYFKMLDKIESGYSCNYAPVMRVPWQEVYRQGYGGGDDGDSVQ